MRIVYQLNSLRSKRKTATNRIAVHQANNLSCDYELLAAVLLWQSLIQKLMSKKYAPEHSCTESNKPDQALQPKQDAD